MEKIIRNEKTYIPTSSIAYCMIKSEMSYSDVSRGRIWALICRTTDGTTHIIKRDEKEENLVNLISDMFGGKTEIVDIGKETFEKEVEEKKVEIKKKNEEDENNTEQAREKLEQAKIKTKEIEPAIEVAAVKKRKRGRPSNKKKELGDAKNE